MNDKERIPTNLRTLRILEILGQSDQPMSPTQINKDLGLPKQTIHRLCKRLVEERYLVRDTHGKGLRPALRLRSLASGVLFSSQFHLLRHQVLLDVASQVNETVNFVIAEKKGMRYMDRVETDWPFQIQLPIGTHVPFHCTASGKAYLSSLSPRARAAAVSCLRLEKLTANTHTDPASLLSELEEVSRRGYALDNEEFVMGMVAIAVPIKDSENRYCASLAFHGPTQRLSLSVAVSQRLILMDAAARLSGAIFGLST